MPCAGCNDKPRQTNPAVFRPATPKVWLGARYAAEVARRGPDFDALVKTKAQQSGVDGATIWIVETAWLDHCRSVCSINGKNEVSATVI